MKDLAGTLLGSLVLWLFLPGWLSAQGLTIFGGTSQERQLTACIEQISAEELDKLPGSDHTMTVVIIEHDKFLQVRDRFGLHRTKLAFSILGARRMYLSSDVFRDRDTVLHCIPHELAHFVTRSVYEDNAEIAARSIRERAREICRPLVDSRPGVWSSHLKHPAVPTE
jgi:hypothetical protein